MEALVATLAIQVRRFKLQISANLRENFGDGFLDTTGQISQRPISSAISHLLHLRRRNSRMSWLVAGQAVFAARPGSIVHASISTNPGLSWCQDSEVARTQSEPERLRGTIRAFD